MVLFALHSQDTGSALKQFLWYAILSQFYPINLEILSIFAHKFIY